MNGKILVTGSDGFIGMNLVGDLVENGFSVRCLIQKGTGSKNFDFKKAEICYGDLLDKDSLIAAAEGVETVFHLAAAVRPQKLFYKRNEFYERFYEVNVLGTKNLVDVLQGRRISRFIFFSTAARAGEGKENILTDYAKTKFMAEDFLMETARKYNFPVIVMRFSHAFGPANLAMLPLFRFVKRGILPSLGRTDVLMPFVYVKNLVSACLAVLRLGIAGRSYYIIDEHFSLREFSSRIAGFLGVKLSPFYIPKNVSSAIVILKERIERLFGFKFCPFNMDISSQMLHMANNDCVFDGTASQKALGDYTKIDMNRAIGETVAWYEHKRLL